MPFDVSGWYLIGVETDSTINSVLSNSNIEDASLNCKVLIAAPSSMDLSGDIPYSFKPRPDGYDDNYLLELSEENDISFGRFISDYNQSRPTDSYDGNPQFSNGDWITPEAVSLSSSVVEDFAAGDW